MNEPGEMTISVVIATFNGSRYIGEQLDSLARQTVPPCEIIVGDDASTDDTLGHVERFRLSTTIPVTIIARNVNIGYSSNFLDATQVARGEMVAFCDQDDIWHPTKLERLRDAFKGSDHRLISHDLEFFSDQRSERPLPTSYFAHLQRIGLSRALCIKGCAMAFRRELLDEVGLPDVTSGWSHDLWLTACTTAAGSRGYIDEPLIRHRLHGANVSGYLIGKPKPLSAVLRRVAIGSLTPRTEIDEFTFLYLDAKRLGDLLRVLSPDLQKDRAGDLRRSCEAWTRLDRLRASKEYDHVGARTLSTLRSFLAGDYRSGGGVLGAAQDLAGRRAIG